MQPIDLTCCKCGRFMGRLDLTLLPRAMQLSLRMLTDQFGGRGAPGADEGAIKIPTVCPACAGLHPLALPERQS